MATTAVTDAHAVRLASYREVQGIVAEFRGNKLHDDEADTIGWAAEGMLLASPDEDLAGTRLAFDTLMDDLEAFRWSEMVGTEAQPGAATRLRRAFAACA